ncbi:MAG: hypothetical protein ACK5LL_17515 [Suipraeoptans sp.]
MKDQAYLNSECLGDLDFIYTGYLLGYLNIKTIQHWADNQLLSININYTEDLLLDISLCMDNKQMISILKRNKSQNIHYTLEYYFSLYRILGGGNKLSYNNLTEDILGAYCVCNNSFEDKSFIEEDEKYNLFFTRLLDYQELIKDGFTGNMNMPQELIFFLSNYHKDISIFKYLRFNIKGIDIRIL